MRDAGVLHAITIGCSLQRAPEAIEIAQQYPDAFSAAVGVHPETCAGTPDEEAIDLGDGLQMSALDQTVLAARIEQITNTLRSLVRTSSLAPNNALAHQNSLASHNKLTHENERHANGLNAHNKRAHVVAIGECGLDYHRPEHVATKNQQIPLFIAQLELARELKLPVILHIRDAFPDALAILKDFTDLNGVVHCFTDTFDHVQAVLEQGWHVGFTGIVTFKPSSFTDVVRYVPMDRLLIETDSPYLSPVPLRGQWPNEPANVVHVAQAIATLRGVDVADVANATANNARRLFQLGSVVPEM